MSLQAKNRIYRKKMCPWGQRAVQLLDDKGITYQDHLFADKIEENQFKQDLQVTTTPQIFINGHHLGGYQELVQYFNMNQISAKSEPAYLPFISIFTISLLISLATQMGLKGFLGFSLATLACLKLTDLKGFIAKFKQYDLFAKTISFYGALYPFLELTVALGLLAGLYPLAVGLIATLIALIELISVIKAVYIEKLNLTCASVGGFLSAPLGFISLLKNIIILAMGITLLSIGLGY